MPELLDLDDPRCADPRLAGGKASILARARADDLPVPAGVVVTAPLSREHMRRGVDALARRGSGGARLEVSMMPLDEDLSYRLTARVARLGEVLVVRSSSVLEAAGEWSGAFTSYLDIHPDEIDRAVTGCWASAFGVGTLQRYEATGVTPGSADMAVLVQAALRPDFGGTARLEGEEVVVAAVAGSPAPLVQGWEPGTQARVVPEGGGRGTALDLLGGETLGMVADLLRRAHAGLGSTSCEWAVVDGRVFLLQLGRLDTSPAPLARVVPDLAGAPARDIARLVRRYPGPLGEALVLPWALGEPSRWLDEVEAQPLDPVQALEEAGAHASRLTAEVWSRPRREAARIAALTLASLRGPDPPWAELATLRPPDPERGRLVVGCLATVREALVEAGAVTWTELGWHLEPAEVQAILSGEPATKKQRIGYDRWEPFNAGVVMSEHRSVPGAPSAPGVGYGRLCWVGEPGDTIRFRPRDVVVAPYPTPDLAALLWDAAGVVTTGGSPAAHLFESARALAIPAVSGAHLDEVLGMPPHEAGGRFALTVDGSSGSVFVTEW